MKARIVSGVGNFFDGNVRGGNFSAALQEAREVDVVTVNALRIPQMSYLPWVDNGYEEGTVSDYIELYDQVDQASIDITDFTGRPLTPSEQAAMQTLREKLDLINALLKLIPDNATLTLSNGMIISGAELKSLFGRLDVQVYDARVMDNNSHLQRDPVTNKVVGGEADYNSGNPVIRLNIGGLEGYARLVGGVEYLITHELSHMVLASRLDLAISGNGPSHERLANDITRAIAAYAGFSILPNVPTSEGGPGYGYSSDFPQFIAPPVVSPSYIPDIPPYIPSWTRNPWDVR